MTLSFLRISLSKVSGADLPCAIDTSIWPSSVTICSALNLFFGMTKAPFKDKVFHKTCSKKSPVSSELTLGDSFG
jgi:hypothetical protein